MIFIGAMLGQPRLILIICGSLCAGAAAADSKQDQLRELRTRIESLKSELNSDRSARDEIRARLDGTERRIAEVTRKLDQTRRAIRDSSDNLERHESRYRDQQVALMRRRDDIALLIRNAYMMGSHGYLKMLLNQDDPATAGRLSVYYRYLTRERLNQIAKIESILEQTRHTRAELERERTNLQKMETMQQRQQDELAAGRTQRQSLLAQVEQRIGSRQGELARLKKDEKRLQRLVSDLQRHLAEVPAKLPAYGRFGEMRGKLPLPVKARIGARFGQPKSNSGLSWQGLFLNAAEGATVSSVFHGRVAFADWLRGFGLLLIIDHGDGYMSLYGHNQVLLKAVGDWVETGDPIARVGTSGGLREPGLYFEVRQNGQPRNPLRWCKAR